VSEEQSKANRLGNRWAAFVIAYALYCVVVAIGAENGAVVFKGKAIGLCVAPALSLFVVIILWNFIADLLQYRREGWNFDERRPRMTFYPGVVPPGPDTRPTSPASTMCFAYPFFILILGFFAILFLGNALGYWLV